MNDYIVKIKTEPLDNANKFVESNLASFGITNKICVIGVYNILEKQYKFFDNEERQQYEEWLKNDYNNEKWMLDRGLNRTEKEDNQNLITDLEDIQIIDNTSEIIKEDLRLSGILWKEFHKNLAKVS